MWWSGGWPVSANPCRERGAKGRRLRACGGLCGEKWMGERMGRIEALEKRQLAEWMEGWILREMRREFRV